MFFFFGFFCFLPLVFRVIFLGFFLFLGFFMFFGFSCHFFFFGSLVEALPNSSSFLFGFSLVYFFGSQTYSLGHTCRFHTQFLVKARNRSFTFEQTCRMPDNIDLQI